MRNSNPTTNREARPARRLAATAALALGFLAATASIAADATVPLDFATISSAVQGATDKDGNGVVDILVLAGTYFENVDIKRSDLVLAGQSAASTIISGNGADHTLEIQSASNVALRNLTLTGGGLNKNGLKLLNASGCTVEQLIVHGNRHGIVAEGGSDNLFLSNEVRDNQRHGLKLKGSDDNLVALNNVHDNVKAGILARPGSGNLIQANTSTGNSNGIRVRETLAANTVTGNTCSGNASNGIHLREAVGTQVSGNLATGNLESGIRMRETTDSRVSGNSFVANSENGIRLEDSLNDDFAAAAGIQDAPGDNDVSGNGEGGVRID